MFQAHHHFFGGLWKELNAKEVKSMGGFVWVYFSSSVIFLVASCSCINIKSGGGPRPPP
jgi:hypothetical protein